MATVTDAPTSGLLNLEKELVCFICTEVLYQPLTLIDCLHSFCGSCLKEWFSYQYKKAAQSRSSHTSNPYTCPTCRTTVKDARHNATVSTLLEMYLAANPDKGKSPAEKEEMAKVYKPGQDILPKLDVSRRSDRRSRRAEEAAEQADRRMVEEARERSLREMRGRGSEHNTRLAAPETTSESGRSRSRESRDREARRERRREQDRQELRRRRAELTEATHGRGSSGSLTESHATTSSAGPLTPLTSPRHPEAVEERRDREVVHQASLRSLVSASESGTGTGDSLNEARIMQEILEEGLLDGINLQDLDPTQEDELSERIAQAYRQRHQRRGQDSSQQSTRTLTNEAQPTPTESNIAGAPQDVTERRHRRHRSGSSLPGTATEGLQIVDQAGTRRPPVARPRLLEATDSLQPPSTSNSTAHRRRASDQSRRRTSPIPPAGRGVSDQGASPNQGTRSATDLSGTAQVSTTPQHEQVRLLSNTRTTSTDPRAATSTSDVWRSRGTTTSRPQTGYDRQVDSPLIHQTPEPTPLPDSHVVEPDQGPVNSVPTRPRPQHAPATVPSASQPTPRHGHSLPSRARTHFTEPSISCARCSRKEIQYDLYKHCSRCVMDICLPCYRASRGCDHWFGFGRSAQYKFEASQPSGRSSQLIELPHVLVGRRYLRPPVQSLQAEAANSSSRRVGTVSTSDPDSRLQEGKFCNRCHSFANACFWSCDYCNEGEWGFCNKCVNSHHCCTHPLLPLSHQSFAPGSSSAQDAPGYDPRRGSITVTPSELHASIVPAAPHDRPLTPEPTAVDGTIPESEYLQLSFMTHCDICTEPIHPFESRYHCPEHSTPSRHDPENVGDYDICKSCYVNIVKLGKLKREDGPNGWRKCSAGHRMIVVEFDDHITYLEGQRRIVINDLVGGHRFTSEDIAAFAAALSSTSGGVSDALPSANGRWTWKENADGTRSSRTRSLTVNSQASKFPPDGGYGKRCVAMWSYYPEEGEGGQGELLFPKGAEIREVEDINEEWYFGVYAGEKGLFPAQYVRILDS